MDPLLITACMFIAMLLLMTTGRIDESLAEIRRALQLDPLSGVINAAAGVLHLAARDHDTAIDRYERAFELNPRQAVPCSAVTSARNSCLMRGLPHGPLGRS